MQNMATYFKRVATSFLNGVYIRPRLTTAQTGAPSASNNQGAEDIVRLTIQRSPNQVSDMVQLIDENSNILASFDKAGNEIQSGVTTSKQFVVQVTLTSANILAMFGAPVTVIAAQGAGIITQVDQIMFEMQPTATQYASGGVVTFQYSGGSAVHSSSIPAATINSASKSMNVLPPTTAVVQAPANTAITITNATGAFTTGTGTATIWIWGSFITQQ